MTVSPTPDELVARARALKPKLRERSDECERIRRLPDETLSDYLDLQFHRMMQPKRFGGFEFGWDVSCACINEWAQGCGSQAWVMMIHSDYAQFIGACSQELQDEIWGEDPDALLASSFQPTAKVEPKNGGYTISGRWGFSSGIDNAKWLIVGGIVPGRGHTYFVVPCSAATVIDDWLVGGLAGTGSKSFTLDGAFVPEHRTITDRELNEGQGRGVTPNSAPIYRSPRKAGAALCFASVPVGVAIGMLDEFKDISIDRAKQEKLTSNVGAALRIAECSAELDAAKWATIDTANAHMRQLERGELLTTEERLLSRRNSGFAAMMAQRASERIYAAAGGASIYRSNAIQRGFRDIHAAANHMALSWEGSATLYGQYAIGQEPPPGGW